MLWKIAVGGAAFSRTRVHEVTMESADAPNIGFPMGIGGF
jgi:hypothetical protein